MQRRHYGGIGPRRFELGPEFLVGMKVQSPNADFVCHIGRQHAAGLKREHFTRAQRLREGLGHNGNRKSEEDQSSE